MGDARGHLPIILKAGFYIEESWNPIKTTTNTTLQNWRVIQPKGIIIDARLYKNSIDVV